MDEIRFRRAAMGTVELSKSRGGGQHDERRRCQEAAGLVCRGIIGTARGRDLKQLLRVRFWGGGVLQEGARCASLSAA